jgi:hypothetical protein
MERVSAQKSPRGMEALGAVCIGEYHPNGGRVHKPPRATNGEGGRGLRQSGR